MRSVVDPEDEHALAGYAVVDDKGRITLTKAMRAALGVEPGSAISYVIVKGRLVIFPQDQELLRLTEEAAAIVAEAGLTPRDLLDQLPAVRDAVMRELYGDAFMDELARQHAAATAERGD